MLSKILPKSKKDVDMTSGSIVRHIISFAIPLLIGNLFQQLYNMVDTWVVGNYVSNEAFAAVGSVAPVINMLIGFFMGLSAGAGVVISQYYGAGQYDKVKKAVHTSAFFTVVLALLFTVIGIAITPVMIRLMNTHEDVIPEATAYLTIYFAGVSGLMIYNMGSGILRAVGDSKRPFYFLFVSAMLNTVLDLGLVLVFGMGVEGVAIATVIAQFVSAVLVVITLIRADNCIKLSFREMRPDREILKKILRIGLPSALQMAITAFSNVFVQSYINYFGKDATSAYSAYVKIDQLLLIPLQAISVTTTTFVGQNLGAGDVKRAKRGISTAVLMTLVSTTVIMIPLLIFAPSVVAFFNDTPAVVEYGALFLRFMSPFYLACCVDMIFAAALRGSGNTKVPMIIMLSFYVVFRQIYLFVMANFISNTTLPILAAYPIGWVLACVAYLVYYFVKGINVKSSVTGVKRAEE